MDFTVEEDGECFDEDTRNGEGNDGDLDHSSSLVKLDPVRQFC